MPHSNRTRFTVVQAMLLVIFIVGIWILAWVPFRRHLRVADVATACSANLRAIGFAAEEYQEVYSQWPFHFDDWEQRLLDARLLRTHQLICPVREDRAFHYRVPALPTSRSIGNGPDVVLYEELDAHWGKSGCILYTDGRVHCIKRDEYPPQLRTDVTTGRGEK